MGGLKIMLWNGSKRIVASLQQFWCLVLWCSCVWTVTYSFDTVALLYSVLYFAIWSNLPLGKLRIPCLVNLSPFTSSWSLPRISTVYLGTLVPTVLNIVNSWACTLSTTRSSFWPQLLRCLLGRQLLCCGRWQRDRYSSCWRYRQIPGRVDRQRGVECQSVEVWHSTFCRPTQQPEISARTCCGNFW